MERLGQLLISVTLASCGVESLPLESDGLDSTASSTSTEGGGEDATAAPLSVGTEDTDGDGSGDGGEVIGDPQAWADAFVQLRCGAFEECDCYEQGGFQFPSPQLCVESLTDYYRQRAEWAVSSGLEISETCFGLIEERLFASSCEPVPPASVFDVWEAQRCRLFVGDGLLGESCVVNEATTVPLDDTCREGLYCRQGQCAEIPSEGEACDADGEWSWCAGHTQCEEDICRPFPALGEACGLAGCADGLSCQDGACVEAPAAGEPCLPDGSCATHACLNDVCTAPLPAVCRATLF